MDKIFNFKNPLVLVGLIASLLLSISAVHAEELPVPISNWYEALQKGDADTLDAILDNEAIIELKDLGISQTKTEFIEALDEWVELNGEAVLLTRLNSEDENGATMDVCYRFKSNEVQTSEVFFMSANLITRSVQQQISENCSGF